MLLHHVTSFFCFKIPGPIFPSGRHMAIWWKYVGIQFPTAYQTLAYVRHCAFHSLVFILWRQKCNQSSAQFIVSLLSIQVHPIGWKVALRSKNKKKVTNRTQTAKSDTVRENITLVSKVTKHFSFFTPTIIYQGKKRVGVCT